MFAQPSRSPPHIPWKKAAIQSAVALTCAGALYAPNAMATPPACGPITVSVTTNDACNAQPNSSQVLTINAGVSIRVNDLAAVYYGGNLGNYEGSGQDYIGNGGLTNHGIIVATGADDTTGIFIENELLGTLTNSNTGQIKATAELENTNLSATGVYEKASVDDYMRGTLTNDGLISATATSTYNAGAYGIKLEKSAASSAVLTNTGNIQATAVSTNQWAYGTAYGLMVVSDFDGKLNNSGTIQATASSTLFVARAIGVSMSDANGEITNSGTIQATVSDSSYLSASGITTRDLNGTLTNSGSIQATASGVNNASAYGIKTAALNGTLTNSGAISGTAENGTGYSIYSTSGNGTLTNQSTGVLRGSLNIGGSGITVNNHGTIDLPLNNYANISGDYTQSSTGTLKIAAQSTSEGGYSRLSVGGTATIAGKALVDVKTVNTLAIGQTLTNVVSAGALVGNFSSVEDNSALFNFVARARDGLFIDLEIVRALTATQAASNTANSPSLGAAGVFDNSANTGLQSVVTVLGQFQTQQQVSDALRQTLPSDTSAAAQATQIAIGQVIDSRTDASKGQSSGDMFYGDKNVWLKPFGSWADQGDRNGVSGFKATTSGLAMGVDDAVSDATRLGFAGAYAKASIDSKSSAAPQSADVNVYQLVGYGSYSLDANTSVNFQADMGRNTNEGRRTIALTSTTASAKYNSLTTHLGASIGRSYKLNEKTTMTPSVRADYSSIKDDGYSETGAGVLNLNVASRTTEQFIVGLDGKLNHQLSPTTRVTGNMGVGYDTMNQRSAITAAFAGAPGASFVTYGAETSPWLMRAGLGLVHQINDITELTARYDAEFREDYLNQTASVKVRWAF